MRSLPSSASTTRKLIAAIVGVRSIWTRSALSKVSFGIRVNKSSIVIEANFFSQKITKEISKSKIFALVAVEVLKFELLILRGKFNSGRDGGPFVYREMLDGGPSPV
jgi:hypothetical protein